MRTSALLIIDTQADFVDGGASPISGTTAILPALAALRTAFLRAGRPVAPSERSLMMIYFTDQRGRQRLVLDASRTEGSRKIVHKYAIAHVRCPPPPAREDHFPSWSDGC